MTNDTEQQREGKWTIDGQPATPEWTPEWIAEEIATWIAEEIATWDPSTTYFTVEVDGDVVAEGTGYEYAFDVAMGIRTTASRAELFCYAWGASAVWATVGAIGTVPPTGLVAVIVAMCLGLCMVWARLGLKAVD
jgi:hypothetical protein